MDSCYCILVRPEDPRNTGAVIRACANFGIAQVRLVAPAYDMHAPEVLRLMRVATSGAWDILGEPAVYNSLQEAVADCRLVLGTTARVRTHHNTSDVAGALANIRQPANYPLAVVFGCESNGLTNEEADHCHALIKLATNPNFASLNQGQAAAVILHAFAPAILLTPTATPLTNQTELPTCQHHERLIQNLRIDAAKQPHAPAQLRRLLQRANPTADEMSMLYSIIKNAKH